MLYRNFFFHFAYVMANFRILSYSFDIIFNDYNITPDGCVIIYLTTVLLLRLGWTLLFNFISVYFLGKWRVRWEIVSSFIYQQTWWCSYGAAGTVLISGNFQGLGHLFPKRSPHSWWLSSYHLGRRAQTTWLLAHSGCPYSLFLLANLITAVFMGLSLINSRLDYFTLCSLAVCISSFVNDGTLTSSVKVALNWINPIN